ncbi:hypothetical protein HYN43_013260 [Mucilaginibacter celer]|uniref:Uncharacterized protein n=2 Tax=Mucilaginibacter celer TaxID=2305508 RepID=A0A494VQH4_9SPHI|nr:hypothetical protein HYN43_013260 [Mucilaginibacter celer]
MLFCIIALSRDTMTERAIVLPASKAPLTRKINACQQAPARDLRRVHITAPLKFSFFTETSTLTRDVKHKLLPATPVKRTYIFVGLNINKPKSTSAGSATLARQPRYYSREHQIVTSPGNHAVLIVGYMKKVRLKCKATVPSTTDLKFRTFSATYQNIPQRHPYLMPLSTLHSFYNNPGYYSSKRYFSYSRG